MHSHSATSWQQMRGSMHLRPAAAMFMQHTIPDILPDILPDFAPAFTGLSGKILDTLCKESLRSSYAVPGPSEWLQIRFTAAQCHCASIGIIDCQFCHCGSRVQLPHVLAALKHRISGKPQYIW